MTLRKLSLLSISFLLLMVSCTVKTKTLSLNHKEYPELQMLWDTDRQSREGVSSRHLLYPKNNANRIAKNAGKKGFYYLFAKKDIPLAIEEFNRAWRFNQNEYTAWWGGGIIRGLDAKKIDDVTRINIALQDSVFLLRKAVELAPVEEKQNAQNDFALSLAHYGYFLTQQGDSARGLQLINEAKKNNMETLQNNFNNGRFHMTAAIIALYDKDFYNAIREFDYAEHLGFTDPEVKTLINTYRKINHGR